MTLTAVNRMISSAPFFKFEGLIVLTWNLRPITFIRQTPGINSIASPFNYGLISFRLIYQLTPNLMQLTNQYKHGHLYKHA